MARQPRIEYKGACYHVMSQGDKHEKIFHEKIDRLKFLEKTGEVVDKFNLKVHCYTLLDDRFHMLIETPEGNLSRCMHHLNSSYSNWFKLKYEVKGSVFQGRYRAVLVEKDGYLMRLSAYIHLTPMREGKVKKPEDYPWSSFARYIGREKRPPWLVTSELLSEFENKKKFYRKYVYDLLNQDEQIKKDDIYGVQSILGGEKFRRKIARKIEADLRMGEIREKPALKSLRRLQPEDISRIICRRFRVERELLYKKRKNNHFRKLFLYGLKKYSDLRLREIGELVEMDYVAVSQMVRRFILESIENHEIKLMIDGFERELKKFRR
ncbi:MAG: transposase [Candidatus Aminicenantes bacterium]|nr:transposase [Candidatus Aminicenantes bacterium]